MLNKNEFLRILDMDVNNHLNKLGDKEKNYVREKGNKIIDLLLELENKGFLKILNQIEAQDIDKKLDNLMFNFEHIKNLYVSVRNMVDNNKQKSPKTEIELKDENGNTYVITMNQVVTIFAWTYCSFCELTREWLLSIMDIDKIKKSYSKQRGPTGLGSLVWLLRNIGVANLSFFDDIDTDIRNSFFHLQFRFDGNKVYCKNNPSKYSQNTWRTPADNNQSEYILLTDLIQLVLNGDRSSYAIMHGVIYFIKKSGF